MAVTLPLSEPSVAQTQRLPNLQASVVASGRRLRVALAITDLDVGGAERALVELARRLDRERFEVRVWGLQQEHSDPARSLVPALRAADVPVATLGARGLRDAPRVVRELASAWRAWQPDVVQTFLFHANMLGRLAAWRARVPVVVSGIRVAERRNPWRLRADRWTDRLVTRHVCVSQAVAEFSRSAGGLPADKIVVIPNGVDTTRFASARPATGAALSLPASRRWITYVGRLDEQKGLDWLIAQAPDWLATHSQHDLLLVGDGPLRSQLEAQARSLGISERVHFLGWRSDVPVIMAASDLMVLTSRWEGMPNVVLEAMAAGRPVLAADVEGVRELLGACAADQTVPAADATQWRQNLARLLGDLQLAARLGQANQQRAAEKFTLAAVASSYGELYESLLRSHRFS